LHTVRSAAKRTLRLTAQTTLSLTRPTLLGGRPAVVIGRAQYSFPRGLGYAALDVPALGRKTAGRAYLVYLPGKLWSKPVVSTGLPQGDLWISATGRSAPSLALAFEGMNPQLLLEEIASGAVSARSAGHRVVAHVPYTEYDVSVDLPRALKATRSEALRTAMQQQLAALRAGGGSTAHVVARVDGQGRIAQLQGSIPGSQLGTVQIGLWRFGGTIPLSLPLANETVDIASLRLSPAESTPGLALRGE
jgi:hypothetical protein